MSDDSAFRKAWAKKEAEGYQYGRDALEQVRLGWDMAESENARLRSQFSALREALEGARQSLQWWATHPDAEPYASWDPPHEIQDPNGTRAALARIDAALASTEPGGEEKPFSLLTPAPNTPLPPSP